MKISTKGRIATTTALVTIGLIAAMIWQANTEVSAADQQRTQPTRHLLAGHGDASFRARAAALHLLDLC